MSYHFSPSAGGVFGPLSGDVPPDSVAITQATYDAMLAAIAARQAVRLASDGSLEVCPMGGRWPGEAVPAPTVEDLMAYAADKRWRVETGGCSDGAGQIINTDRDSQSKLLAEMIAIGAGLRADPSRWKMRDGFVMLTNAQMMAVITKGRAHVIGSFSIEDSVRADIAAGTIKTTAHIDALSWPANT